MTWCRQVLWGKCLGLVMLVLACSLGARELFVRYVGVNSWNGNIELTLNNDEKLDTDSLDGKVTISPEVEELKVLYVWDEIQLTGKFRHGQQYVVRFGHGIEDTAGNRMQETQVIRVNYPDKRTSVSPLSRGVFLPLKRQDWTMPVQLVNADTVKVTAYAFTLDNLIAYGLGSVKVYQDLNDGLISQQYKMTLPRNRQVQGKVELKSLLPAEKPGLYVVQQQVEDADAARRKQEQERLNAGVSYTSINYYAQDEMRSVVVVTDLAMTLCHDRQGRKAHVAVQRLSDRQPVAETELLLYSQNNHILARGRTDALGCAMLSYDHFMGAKGEPRVLVARKGDDITFIELFNRDSDQVRQTMRSSYFTSHPRGEADTGRPLVTKPEAFVYFERGVARPGEALTVSAFLRQRQEDGYRTLRDFPCVISLRDSSNNEHGRYKLKSDAHGFVSQRFELEPSMRTGSMTAVVSVDDGEALGTAQAQVALYVPDNLKLDVTMTSDQVMFQDKIGVRTKVAYNHGGSASGLRQEVFFWLEKAPSPRHWEDYSVGENVKMPERFAYAKYYKESSATANESWYVWEEEEQAGSFPVRLVAQVTVYEPSGRAVSGRASAFCDVSEWYLGLKSEEARGAQPVLRYKALMSKPKATAPVERAEAKLAIQKVEWQYVEVEFNGRFERRWEKVRQPFVEIVRVVEAAEGEWVLPEMPGGQYEVLVCVGDKIRTHHEFWHWKGESGQRVKNPSILTFKLDRPSYKPGDTAKITFEADVAGHFVWTAGEAGLEAGGAMPLKPGENSFEVKIPATVQTERYLCGVTAIGGEGEESRLFGVAGLTVKQEMRRLQIALDVPEVARPQQETTLTVRLTDAAGQPVSGLAHLFLVDEGILSLTDYKTPDIFGFFHGQRLGNMDWCDSYSAIYPELKLQDAMRIGGDGIATSLRGTFKNHEAAVLVLPPVSVDETGKAHVKVKMPKLLGAMRVMCVAAGEKHCGSQDAEVIVRDELGVLASVPRAVAPGDEFDFTFVLNNFEVPQEEYVFDLALPSAFEFVDGASPRRRGRLGKGGSEVVRCRVRALEQLGRFELTYSLTMGDLKSGGSCTLHVRSSNPPTTVTHTMALPPGTAQTFGVLADQWLTGTASAKISLSPAPLTGLDEALTWLNDYPYGCLEQTVSCAFPFLYVPELARIGLMDQAEAKGHRAKLEAAMSRIQSMHLGRGRFSLWPGGEQAHNDATLYASHFIFKMAELTSGYAELVKQVETHLQDYISLTLSKNDANLAYALYVLSLRASQNKKFASMVTHQAQNLLAQRGVKPMARFLAAMSLVNCARAAEAMPQLQRAIREQVWNDRSGHIDMSSPASRCGMLLAMLYDVMPDDPVVATVAAHLDSLRRADGRAWGTPQANAWACVGLACYASGTGSGAVSPAQGTMQRNGGASEPIPSDIVSTLTLKMGDSLKITNQGKTPLFVSCRTRGIQRGAMLAEQSTIGVRRRYLNEKSEPIQRCHVGDIVLVELEISSNGGINDIVIADMLPGGLEIEDDGLMSRAHVIRNREQGDTFTTLYVDKRDDRFLLFGNFTKRGECKYVYPTRAVTAGDFILPPLTGEAMYAPEVRATYVPQGTLTIE